MYKRVFSMNGCKHVDELRWWTVSTLLREPAVSSKFVAGGVRLYSPPVAWFACHRTGVGTLLPDHVPFSVSPVAANGVTFEVSIAVAVALLKQLEEGIAQRGVHAHVLTRMVAADAMAGETFLEQCLFVGAAAVEVTWRGHAGRMRTALATRVMPSTERIASAVERAKLLDPCMGTSIPAGLEGRRRAGCRCWGRQTSHPGRGAT
jgi:hypothetical protein